MPRVSMRDEIVEAAVETFHASGFHRAGIREVAQAAGAPKGSIYNHFTSKDELAVEAVRRYGERRHLPELTRPGVPALDRLRTHFELLRDDAVGNDLRRGCLLGNLSAEAVDHSEDIRAAVTEAFDHWREALASTIREAQQDGTMRTDADAALLAGFVLNAWEGALLGARAHRTERAFDEFFAVTFGILLH